MPETTTGTPRLALRPTQVVSELATLQGWKLHGDADQVAIEKTWHFGSYLQTLAFVNAVAWLAERQDHHPEMLVQYQSCSVRFRSHDVKGISLADFDCARLVDALHPPTTAVG